MVLHVPLILHVFMPCAIPPMGHAVRTFHSVKHGLMRFHGFLLGDHAIVIGIHLRT